MNTKQDLELLRLIAVANSAAGCTRRFQHAKMPFKRQLAMAIAMRCIQIYSSTDPVSAEHVIRELFELPQEASS